MEIGTRIREKLKELGLSQTELARRAGVSQPTISDLIRGDSRSSSHLHVIARELGTTPAYLAGETADPTLGAAELAYSPDEREWLLLIRKLSSRERHAVRQMLIALAGASLATETPTPSQTVHSPQQQYRGQ